MEISKNNPSWKDKIFNAKLLPRTLGTLNSLVGIAGVSSLSPGSVEFIASIGLIYCAGAMIWLSETYDKFDKKSSQNISKKHKYAL